ncbi:MAG: patatin-like phospholipase family protein [Aureibaculum sp.]|nr:patatin-like phospholipase family protein [Aureibaculum sp.]
MNKKTHNKFFIIFFFFISSSIILFPTISFAVSKDFNKQKRPYSLTISGGISLGVYEAGLNWVIIEQLRNGRLKGDEMVRLLAITGASAGAINTLIAALRYCEVKSSPSTVEDNLFNKTWRTIGVEGLLPNKQSDYGKQNGHHDGVFSRKVFNKSIDQLTEKAHARIYRDNCFLNLGLTVTRHIPEDKIIGKGDDKQNIKVQRFVIPLILRTKNGYAVFGNNLNYPKRNKELGYLFLPQDNNGIIPFNKIIDSALASSAYPFAFGRIRLNYCRAEKTNETNRNNTREKKLNISSNSLLCPKSYKKYTYDFIDGGFFDNVPLGLAVELSECRKHLHDGCIKEAVSKREILGSEIVNYIYMDPGKRRKHETIKTLQDEELNDGFGLYNQGKFWFKAQEVYANGELYRALKDKFDIKNNENKLRKLLLTDRYPPLAGAYLGHFGAFFGQIFRDFDYYVGVYDGIINFSNLCLKQGKKYLNTHKYTFNVKSQCVQLGITHLADSTNPHYQHERRIGQIVQALVKDLLSKEDVDALMMVRIMAEDEFNTYSSGGIRFVEWAWLDDLPDYNNLEEKNKSSFLYALFLELKKDKNIDFSNLLMGLKKLKVEYPDNFNSHPATGSNKKLSEMIDDPDTWIFGLGRKVFSRLHQLEKEDADNKFGLIPIKLASMALNSYEPEENNKIWSISSVKPTGWQHLIPDEVALDGSQTGLVFTYRTALYRFKGSKTYFEGELSPLHWVRKRDDRTFFVSTGINIRHANTSPAFSSFGVGIRAYKNYSGKDNLDNDVIPGVAIDVGLFADKYRISIEHKFLHKGYTDERWLLKFGLNDFKGISNLLF